MSSGEGNEYIGRKRKQIICIMNAGTREGVQWSALFERCHLPAIGDLREETAGGQEGLSLQN